MHKMTPPPLPLGRSGRHPPKPLAGQVGRGPPKGGPGQTHQTPYPWGGITGLKEKSGSGARSAVAADKEEQRGRKEKKEWFGGGGLHASFGASGVRRSPNHHGTRPFPPTGGGRLVFLGKKSK